MRGWSTKELSALCPCFRTPMRDVIDTFLTRTGTPLQVIETARDIERQRYYVEIGASKPATLEDGPHRGKHLTWNGEVPLKASDARVLACDVAPRSYLTLPGWNPEGRLWGVLGDLVLGSGLLWGGDWDNSPGRRPYHGWDFPHVYQRACTCEGGR